MILGFEEDFSFALFSYLNPIDGDETPMVHLGRSDVLEFRDIFYHVVADVVFREGDDAFFRATILIFSYGNSRSSIYELY